VNGVGWCGFPLDKKDHATLIMTMRDYGTEAYWDERYAAQDGSNFDWYQDFGTLRPHLLPYLQNHQNFEILIPGCGNSRLGAELYDSGFVNLTCIDTSPVVINQMSDRYADKEEMEFTVMDVRRMEIPDACFDLIIDKALFDAQLCGEDNLNFVTEMVAETCRVLKPGGMYICISHGLPSTRMAYLQAKGIPWSVDVVEIPKPPLNAYEEQGASAHHYMYVCTKSEKA